MTAPANTQGGEGPTKEDLLRITFIEMLFALAISAVAVHAAELATLNASLADLAPSIAHLALGLLLVATSWVGWRQSISPGMREQVKSIISLAFVGLLLDVLIVVVYFIIIKQVEVKTVNDVPTLLPPSARPEAGWMCVVFGIYALWDLLADVLPAGCLNEPSFRRRLHVGARAIFVSTFASVCCLAMCYLVYAVAEPGLPGDRVVYLDLALISVVVLFRLFKLGENWLAPLLRVQHLPAFSKKRQITSEYVVAFVISTLVYVAAVFAR